MTITEAISMLKAILKDREPYRGGSGNEAVKLGIEALKFKKDIRAHTVDDFDALLPGETEPEPQPTRDEVKRYMDERKGEPKE